MFDLADSGFEDVRDKLAHIKMDGFIFAFKLFAQGIKMGVFLHEFHDCLEGFAFEEGMIF